MITKLKQRFCIAFVVVTSTMFALVSGEIALRVIGFQFELYPTKVQFGWPDPVTLHNSYHVDIGFPKITLPG